MDSPFDTSWHKTSGTSGTRGGRQAGCRHDTAARRESGHPVCAGAAHPRDGQGARPPLARGVQPRQTYRGM